MNGLTGLTLEDEPTHVYEKYAGYLTTNSEPFSSILPLLSNNS
ncbi:1044_t:CDS:1, partial [Entrophospora sp. SA101]